MSVAVYTKEFLLNNGITDKIEELNEEGTKILRTISIPKSFIDQQRIDTLNSLSEGCIVQGIHMRLFNVDNINQWDSENQTYAKSFKCDPYITDTHRVYVFTIHHAIKGEYK